MSVLVLRNTTVGSAGGAAADPHVVWNHPLFAYVMRAFWPTVPPQATVGHTATPPVASRLLVDDPAQLLRLIDVRSKHAGPTSAHRNDESVHKQLMEARLTPSSYEHVAVFDNELYPRVVDEVRRTKPKDDRDRGIATSTTVARYHLPYLDAEGRVVLSAVWSPHLQLFLDRSVATTTHDVLRQTEQKDVSSNPGARAHRNGLVSLFRIRTPQMYNVASVVEQSGYNVDEHDALVRAHRSLSFKLALVSIGNKNRLVVARVDTTSVFKAVHDETQSTYTSHPLLPSTQSKFDALNDRVGETRTLTIRGQFGNEALLVQLAWTIAHTGWSSALPLALQPHATVFDADGAHPEMGDNSAQITIDRELVQEWLDNSDVTIAAGASRSYVQLRPDQLHTALVTALLSGCENTTAPVLLLLSHSMAAHGVYGAPSLYDGTPQRNDHVDEYVPERQRRSSIAFDNTPAWHGMLSLATLSTDSAHSVALERFDVIRTTLAAAVGARNPESKAASTHARSLIIAVELMTLDVDVSNQVLLDFVRPFNKAASADGMQTTFQPHLLLAEYVHPALRRRRTDVHFDVDYAWTMKWTNQNWQVSIELKDVRVRVQRPPETSEPLPIRVLHTTREFSSGQVPAHTGTPYDDQMFEGLEYVERARGYEATFSDEPNAKVKARVIGDPSQLFADTSGDARSPTSFMANVAANDHTRAKVQRALASMPIDESKYDVLDVAVCKKLFGIDFEDRSLQSQFRRALPDAKARAGPSRTPNKRERVEAMLVGDSDNEE